MPRKARRAGFWLLLVVGLSLVALVLANRLWPLSLPDEEGARIVLAHDGTPLWRFADRNGVWRHPVGVTEVSPLYLEALLTYEDRWFHHHYGVNPFALARAAWQNLTSGRVVSGGSTLSMQVARLLHPHPRTFAGKLQQVWRTLQLEWTLTKDEILALYLNRAPFGGTLEGVAAASWTLLGKSPSHLTHAEAALLVVLPQAPSRLRPDRHPERAQAARDKVLRRMLDQGRWTVQVVREAIEEPVMLAPRDPPGLAPLLARRVSGERREARITTTIDAVLQRRVENLLPGWRARLPSRTSMAILVAEHDTMAVRAYVGSVDFNDAQRFGHVDMVRALRSPGSTLKPFLTGLALDAGLIHSESLLQDVPRQHSDYRPGNFATGFSGPVSAAEALARSLNLPAVQLIEAYGPRRFSAELQQSGVGLVVPGDAPPSLAVILGGVGTRLEDLVAGYRAFAREGRGAHPRWFDDAPLQTRPLMSPAAAWVVRETLLGRRASGQSLTMDAPAQGSLAWKTGTSYGFRDAWAIGVGPRYLIGIWVGRPDGTPVAAQYGVATAAPLLFQIHDLLTHGGRGEKGWHGWHAPAPAGVTIRDICWPGGQPLPAGDPDCRQLRRAWVVDGVVPPTLALTERPADGAQSLMFWTDAAGLRVAPDCPGAQRQTLWLWPAALEPWLPPRERRELRLPGLSQACPPSIDRHTLAPLRILGVSDGDSLRLPGARTGPLTLSLVSTGGEGRRWWFHNGARIAEATADEPIEPRFEGPGEQEISVVDAGGQVARVRFRVLGQ